MGAHQPGILGLVLVKIWLVEEEQSINLVWIPSQQNNTHNYH